jgi:hypothetical protein
LSNRLEEERREKEEEEEEGKEKEEMRVCFFPSVYVCCPSFSHSVSLPLLLFSLFLTESPVMTAV